LAAGQAAVLRGDLRVQGRFPGCSDGKAWTQFYQVDLQINPTANTGPTLGIYDGLVIARQNADERSGGTQRWALGDKPASRIASIVVQSPGENRNTGTIYFGQINSKQGGFYPATRGGRWEKNHTITIRARQCGGDSTMRSVCTLCRWRPTGPRLIRVFPLLVLDFLRRVGIPQ